MHKIKCKTKCEKEGMVINEVRFRNGMLHTEVSCATCLGYIRYINRNDVPWINSLDHENRTLLEKALRKRNLEESAEYPVVREYLKRVAVNKLAAKTAALLAQERKRYNLPQKDGLSISSIYR